MMVNMIAKFCLMLRYFVGHPIHPVFSLVFGATQTTIFSTYANFFMVICILR